MTGTELEIIPPERSQIAGSDAERQPSLQTTARTDLELLAVWLKSHVDGSDHTVRAYGRIGRRFLDALKVAGVDLRRATDGTPAKAATVNANVAIVKTLLGFAHQVGYTRFNAEQDAALN